MSDHTRKASDEEEREFLERVGEPSLTRLKEIVGGAEGVLKSSDSGERKLDRLIRLAEDFTAAIAPVAACRGRGCSHCCKMSVNITEREALRIAKHTGLKMVRVPVEHDPEKIMERLDADVARYAGQACPFLVDDACSIYPARPLACHLAHSLEATPDKCDLTRGRHWLRKLNTGSISMVLAVIDINRAVGDIRDYFPTGGQR